MKLREFFKTLILTVLVISSVILASKIWFSEELWSNGYNSFSYNSFIFSKLSSLFKKEPGVRPLEYNQIFFPKQLMLQSGGTAVLLKPTDSGYESISNEIKELLDEMFDGYTVSEISNDEFKKVCKTPSVFVDFYNDTSFKMLGDYFGAADNSLSGGINNIRQLLITPDDSSVYARNNLSGIIYKCVFGGNTEKLIKRIESATQSASSGQRLYSYAFDNGFDVLPEDYNGPSRMLLDPYIIINIGESDIPYTEPVVLIKDKDSATYGRLLEVFDMKLNTSRYFSESDGTSNYIENYAKLRMNKNGSLEYTSMDNTKGIELGEGISSDYDIIKASGEFLEEVNSVFPLPESNDYVFNRLESADGKYRVYFDLTFNGIPVSVYSPEGVGSNVEIIVEGTKIVSYNQTFIALESTGGSMTTKNMINALDDFYTVYDGEDASDIRITDMYNTYYYNGSDKAVGVKWVVTLSNKEQIVLEGK